MLHTLLVTLVLVPCLLATPAGAAPSAVAPAATVAASTPERAPERAPAALFAAHSAERLRSGWHISGLDVLNHGDELALELTLSGGADRAVRYTLAFDPEGQQATDYRREVVSPPRQRRTYRFAAELSRLLAAGPVSSLQAECGSYFLEGVGGGASVDPYDYYEVVRTARNGAARRMLARSLAASAGDDQRISGIHASVELPPGAASALDIVLFDGSEETLHVGLDASGKVIYVELRWSPVAYNSWARLYTGGAAMARAVRAGGAVLGLEYDAAAAEPQLVARLRGGKSFVVKLADFAVAEQEDDEFVSCPC